MRGHCSTRGEGALGGRLSNGPMGVCETVPDPSTASRVRHTSVSRLRNLCITIGLQEIFYIIDWNVAHVRWGQPLN